MFSHTHSFDTVGVPSFGEARPSSRSILLVDHHPDDVEEVSGILRSEGYEVTTCIDAVECLLQLGRRTYDLVLLEVELPDIDGCLLVEVLSQKWVDSEILLMTSLPALELASRYPRSDPKQVLWKPITRELLFERVTKALHSHGDAMTPPPLPVVRPKGNTTRRWASKRPPA